MGEGTPQGSALSPVIRPIYIADTLQKSCLSIEWSLTKLVPSRQSTHTTTRPNHIPRARIKIFSYVGDINPFVVTNLSKKGHDSRTRIR